MKTFSYIMVPRNRSINGDIVIIKDENPYILIFLNKVLDIKSNIYLGHSSWNINPEFIVIDVKKALNDYETYNNNLSFVFCDIIKTCFKVNINLRLYFRYRFGISVYEKYFYIGYEKAISEFSNNLIYDGLLYATDEYINTRKSNNILYINKK